MDDVTHAYTQINTGGNGDRNLHNYKTTILSNPASSSSYVPPKGYVKVLPQLADIKWEIYFIYFEFYLILNIFFSFV